MPACRSGTIRALSCRHDPVYPLAGRLNPFTGPRSLGRLALIAIVLALVVLPWPALVAAQSADGVTVLLVIDNSGSNAGALGSRATDPLERRCTAARLFTDLLDDSDSLGVVTFSTSASVLRPLSQVGGNRDAIKLALTRCQAQGDTNYVAALNEAASQLERDTSTRKKIVVFLTDGEPTIGGDADAIRALASDLGARGLPVIPVALDVSLDPDLLRDIAQRSGGRVYQATTAEALPSIFQDIFSSIKGGVLETNRVCPGQPVSFALPSYISRSLVAVAAPDASTVEVKPPASARPSVRQGSAPLEQQTYTVYDVASPGGQWQLAVTRGTGCVTVVATNLVPVDVDYGNLPALALADHDLPITLNVRLTPPGQPAQPVENAAVEALITLTGNTGKEVGTSRLVFQATGGGTYQAVLPAQNRQAIVSIDPTVMLDSRTIYARRTPRRVELVPPPSIQLQQPASGQRLSLGLGDTAPLELRAAGGALTGLAATAIISGPAGADRVPFGPLQAGRATATWSPAASGAQTIVVETQATLTGPLLGGQAIIPITLAPVTVQAEVRGPDLVLTSPAANGSGESLPIVAKLTLNGQPYTLPGVVMSATVTGPKGFSAQSLLQSADGQTFQGSVPVDRIGDYDILVAASQPGGTAALRRSFKTAWTVTPRLDVASGFGNTIDLGTITSLGDEHTATISVSSNSPQATRITVTSPNPDLEITAAPAEIAPYAQDQQVELSIRLRDGAREGSHQADLRVASDSQVAGQPVTVNGGALANAVTWQRPGTLELLWLALQPFLLAGAVAAGAATALFAIWRSRQPSAAHGTMIELDPEHGYAETGRSVVLQPDRRPIRRRLFRPAILELGGDVQIPVVSAGQALLLADTESNGKPRMQVEALAADRVAVWQGMPLGWKVLAVGQRQPLKNGTVLEIREPGARSAWRYEYVYLAPEEAGKVVMAAAPASRPMFNGNRPPAPPAPDAIASTEQAEPAARPSAARPSASPATNGHAVPADVATSTEQAMPPRPAAPANGQSVAKRPPAASALPTRRSAPPPPRAGRPTRPS